MGFDPATLFTGLKVISGAASGMSGFVSGMTDAANFESQAALAKTQMLQRDTYARESLNSTLSSMRVARAANGLSPDSPNAYVLNKSAQDISDRERSIERADGLQKVANYQAAAKSAKKGAGISLVTGAASGGIPVMEYGFNEGWW